MKKTDVIIHFGVLTTLTHYAMAKCHGKDQIRSLKIMEPPHLRG